MSLSGGSERGGDHPDHPPPAQGAPPLPVTQAEEGSGGAAA